jgi:ABC-2 type transport system permease protein
MNKRVWAIVRKEWADVFRNKMVLMVVLLPPALMTVLSIGTMYGTGHFAPSSMGNMGAFTSRPQYAGLGPQEAAQVLTASYFMTLFLLMPLIVPVSIAAYSIVGEKVQRSLEPLLATPISTTELLLGKCMAAILPALGVTYGAFGLFAIGARLFAVSPLAFSRLITPVWVLLIMVVSPLVAVLGVALSVMMSSRVNDPRAVEQSIGVLVVPVLGLFVAQMSGLLTLSYTVLAIGGLAIIVIDIAVMRLAVRLFDREAILTRWK